jgi:hypothetical protein
MKRKPTNTRKPKADTLERALKRSSALQKVRRVNSGIVGQLLKRIDDAQTLMGMARDELNSKIHRIGGGDRTMAGTMQERASLSGSGKLERAAQDLEFLQDTLNGIIHDIRHYSNDDDDDDDDRRKPNHPEPVTTSGTLTGPAARSGAEPVRPQHLISG